MDSYMNTVENEILINSGTTYNILDVGVLSGKSTDDNGNEITDTRNYVLLQLINE